VIDEIRCSATALSYLPTLRESVGSWACGVAERGRPVVVIYEVFAVCAGDFAFPTSGERGVSWGDIGTCHSEGGFKMELGSVLSNLTGKEYIWSQSKYLGLIYSHGGEDVAQHQPFKVTV